MELLSACNSELQLRYTLDVEIHPQGNECHALALNGGSEPATLLLVHQDFARAPRLMIEAVRHRVFWNVGIDQEYLAILRKKSTPTPCLLEFVKGDSVDQFLEDAATLRRWISEES